MINLDQTPTLSCMANGRANKRLCGTKMLECEIADAEAGQVSRYQQCSVGE